MSEQPKSTGEELPHPPIPTVADAEAAAEPTGEWTVDRIYQYHPLKDHAKQLALDINAAIADERERVKKLSDEWWGMALAAEREQLATVRELREHDQQQLAAERDKVRLLLDVDEYPLPDGRTK